MLTFFQAVIFGAVQGTTELFPISSLGHSVILPKLLGWQVHQEDPYFLTFLVATHTATATVLFVYFLKDWKLIIAGIIRSIKQREVRENDTYAKLGWLLVIATIPAGILGLLFEEPLKKLFASPTLVAGILFLNGLLLFGAELLRRNKRENKEEGSDQRIAKLKWFEAVKVGLLQSLALIPGFSRTGSAITGGLMVNLSHEDAARFSFLLATPIIGAAALLKLPELITTQEKLLLGPIVTGSIFAGIFAYLSIKFLTKYFQTQTLKPFALYCMAAGIIFLLLILTR